MSAARHAGARRGPRDAPDPARVSGLGVLLSRVSLELGGAQVLRRVSLDLEPGSCTLLVGANGAGKSQLLKVLAAERWPAPEPPGVRRYRQADAAPVDERDVRPLIQLVSAEQQDRYERYDWNYTVATIVGTGCRALNAPLGPLTRTERARSAQCLAQVGLAALARRRFLSLSYGQKRLVLIARALAGQPRLLLLDEVYNGLDAGHRRRLDRILAALCRTGITLVVSAHRADDAPAALGRALAMEHGRLRYAGPRATLPARFAAHVAPATHTSVPPPAGRSRSALAPLLRLERVSVYRDYRPVLRALTWRIGTGEHWAILGPNGSGKTTLLLLLHGSLWAAAGGAVVRRDHGPGARVEAWQERVRLLGPDVHVESRAWPTLEAVVLTGIPQLRRLAARPTPEQRRAARAALRTVGLTRLRDRHPAEVSYGQLRLALLARALIGRPQALLLDEPLTGLDGAMRARMRAALSRVARSGTQLIAAVHHADDLVPEITRSITLPHGRTARIPPRVSVG